MLNEPEIDYAGVFILISSIDGDIFGAFCDKKLYPRQATTIVKYTGRRGCFTFRFKPAATSAGDSDRSTDAQGQRKSVKGRSVDLGGHSAGAAGSAIDVWRWSGLNEMFFRALKSAGMSGGIEGVGHPAAFVLGGGVGGESVGVGYALTVSADGQTASTAPCETFGSPALCGDGSRGNEIVTVQVARLELILLTDVFVA